VFGTVAIGSRMGDPEVRALGLHWQGRAMVRDGQLPEGLAALDESMTAVVAGEVAPYVAGSLYCSMIDACRLIDDIRRAHEWTVALTTWCDQQPDMFTFSGQCLVHRAEIMQVHGQWPEATDRLRRGALLPAQVEIALEAGDFEAAATAAEELATIAGLHGTPVLRAEASRSQGAVRAGHRRRPRRVGGASRRLAGVARAGRALRSREGPRAHRPGLPRAGR
jgi:hypothetical protein